MRFVFLYFAVYYFGFFRKDYQIGFFTKRTKVGLALGAGSARGLAHIGVLKVLEKEKIPIRVITGTSAGALVGGLFAAGKSAVEMQEILINADLRVWAKIFFPTFPKGGFIDGKRISEFIRTLVGDVKVEDFSIKFAAIATDFLTGEEVVITKGPLNDIIRASASLPGMFSPFWQKNRLLCDGGLVNPLPIDICRIMGADFIIAVNVNPRLSIAATELAVHSTMPDKKPEKNQPFEERIMNLVQRFDKDSDFLPRLKGWLDSHDDEKATKSPFNLFEALFHSFSIVYARNLFYRTKSGEPEIIIEPDTSTFSGTDYDKSAEIIKVGEMSAIAKLREIKKKLKL